MRYITSAIKSIDLTLGELFLFRKESGAALEWKLFFCLRDLWGISNARGADRHKKSDEITVCNQ